MIKWGNMCEDEYWSVWHTEELSNYKEPGAYNFLKSEHVPLPLPDRALEFSTMAKDTLRPRQIVEFLAVPDIPPPPHHISYLYFLYPVFFYFHHPVSVYIFTLCLSCM